MQQLAIILMVVGGLICIIGAGLALRLGTHIRFSLIIYIVGAILLIVGAFNNPALNGRNYADIANRKIEYKSIDVATRKYYAIGQDGSIYIITKEQWAALDAPVIAETK